MDKPEDYPLPWCEKFDAPYWQINIRMCLSVPGWRGWQRDLRMAEIIPEIDRRLSVDA